MSCNCNGEHNHEHHEESQCHDDCKCHDDHHHEDMGVIYLTLEDDSEVKCEVIVVFEVEDKEYIALLPEGEENVFLYKYEETEEGPELSIIEDDDEFDKVAEIYNEMMKENSEEE